MMTKQRLKVNHIPQVGYPASFEYEVSNVVEGWIVLDLLAKYDQFQLDNNIKPDYASCQSLCLWNEQEQEWWEYDAEEELGAPEPDITNLTLEQLKFWVEANESRFLTADEIEQRLQNLRDHNNLTNQQVIEMAKEGTLPSEPYFAEWLVLLDRGDLIHTGR